MVWEIGGWRKVFTDCESFLLLPLPKFYYETIQCPAQFYNLWRRGTGDNNSPLLSQTQFRMGLVIFLQCACWSTCIRRSKSNSLDLMSGFFPATNNNWKKWQVHTMLFIFLLDIPSFFLTSLLRGNVIQKPASSASVAKDRSWFYF